MEIDDIRLLFICHSTLDPDKSGVARVNDNLAKEFIRRGAKVYAIGTICAENHYNEQYVYPNSIVDSEDNKLFIQQIIIKHSVNCIIVTMPSIFKYRRLIEGVRGSVFLIGHFHNSPKAVTSFFDKFRSLHISYNLQIMKIVYYIQRMRNKKQNLQMMKTFDKIIVLSPSYLSEIEDIAPGYSYKVTSIYNPFYAVNVDYSIKEKKNTIIYVGRIEEGQKKISYLLNIWKKVSKNIPNWTLKIVGGGPDLEYFKQVASNAKIPNLTFEGFQNPRQYYEEAKIIMMTSAYEGFPMVLVEAMQYGCVPIAFDSFAALKDIVHDGLDGVIIPPFSIKQYVLVLKSLCEDSVNLDWMSKNAMKNAGRFNIQTVINDWMSLFAEIHIKS